MAQDQGLGELSISSSKQDGGRVQEKCGGYSSVHLLGLPRVDDKASKVTFKALSDNDIAHYHSLVNPLDKAGAYAIQEHGDLIIDRIDGFRTNVIGLPMELVKELLSANSLD